MKRIVLGNDVIDRALGLPLDPPPPRPRSCLIFGCVLKGAHVEHRTARGVTWIEPPRRED